MPITTPDTHIELYRDGKEHFQHIQDCLIIPAIEQAGYEPIPPQAQGAVNIPADIIHNLENSDVVLCDLSTLNPNVFFEFGIRTSLNKPVCVIKDDLTENVPFDANTINNLTYSNTIDPWILPSEINNLHEHLKLSVERSKGQNPLWRYFGMKTEATGISKNDFSTEDKFDFLLNQFESVKSQINQIHKRVDQVPSHQFSANTVSNSAHPNFIIDLLYNYFSNLDTVELESFRFSENELVVNFQGEFNQKDKRRLHLLISDKLGAEFHLTLNKVTTSPHDPYNY